MFEQFRAHFPQGSLISELIQIDHGKYIVRASVQNDGLTLATGLAAADTVEQAEDQARTRALAVLDISLAPSQPAPRLSKEPQTPPSSPSTPAKADSSSPEKSTAAVRKPDKQTVPSQLIPDFSNGSAEGEITKTTSPVSSLETEAEQQSSETAQARQEQTSKAVESESQAENQREATIMDNSDIIARTNIELRRLNWTSEQGRKFLEETYGKRSRSLLSESELLEFLQYLEKQPTPTQDSD